MLAAEPDMKRGRDQPESSKGNRFCAYHNLYTHNTNECQELRAVREGHFGRRPERNDRGYGREEDVAEDAGTTMAHGRSGATGLVRTAGRISLVRIARKVTQASLRCRRSQGETRTATKMRGLGASRSHA